MPFVNPVWEKRTYSHPTVCAWWLFVILMFNLCLSDLRTTRARLLDMFTDSTCSPEIMKKSSDEYFALLQGLCTVVFPLIRYFRVARAVFLLISMYSALRHVVVVLGFILPLDGTTQESKLRFIQNFRWSDSLQGNIAR